MVLKISRAKGPIKKSCKQSAMGKQDTASWIHLVISEKVLSEILWDIPLKTIYLNVDDHFFADNVSIPVHSLVFLIRP